MKSRIVSWTVWCMMVVVVVYSGGCVLVTWTVWQCMVVVEVVMVVSVVCVVLAHMLEPFFETCTVCGAGGYTGHGG